MGKGNASKTGSVIPCSLREVGSDRLALFKNDEYINDYILMNKKLMFHPDKARYSIQYSFGIAHQA